MAHDRSTSEPRWIYSKDGKPAFYRSTMMFTLPKELACIGLVKTGGTLQADLPITKPTAATGFIRETASRYSTTPVDEHDPL